MTDAEFEANLKRYSREELLEIAQGIDKEKFPNRYALVTQVMVTPNKSGIVEKLKVDEPFYGENFRTASAFFQLVLVTLGAPFFIYFEFKEYWYEKNQEALGMVILGSFVFICLLLFWYFRSFMRKGTRTRSSSKRANREC